MADTCSIQESVIWRGKRPFLEGKTALFPSETVVSVGWVRKTRGPVFTDTRLCIGGVVPVGRGGGMALGVTPVGLGEGVAEAAGTLVVVGDGVSVVIADGGVIGSGGVATG